MGDENSPNNEANKPVGVSGDNGGTAEQNGTTMNGNDAGIAGGAGGGTDSTTTATSSPAVSSVVAADGANGIGICGRSGEEIDVIVDQNGDNNLVPGENGALNGEPTASAAGDTDNANNDVEEQEINDGVNNESAEVADNGGGAGVDGDVNPPGNVNVGGGGDVTDADGDGDGEFGGGPPTDTGLLSEGGLSSIIGVGPPSPLTGCYLLIVLGEPHSDEHKDIILQRLIKGLLSWDMSDCHVDLEEELNTITQHSPEGEEARYGERLIQYASENLVTEILIHPQYNTLIQCMRNLLSSFTRHRHIIHSGYTFSGNGSWILQDGTFSVSDFSEAFQEHEVQRVIRAYPDTISTNIHCADAGLWITLPDKTYAKLCKIRINPNDVLNTSEKINEFIDYLAPMLVPATIHDLLETSDVVGNIRFSHPTLYVFPGGQGDAALFGINGFNMLVDGGFNRKACFWDFARHLDRLDAVLLTRINNSNISGLSSVVERKKDDHVYPQIGHFFCNIPERKSLPSPDGDKDKDPLLIELIERGHNLVGNLKVLNLKPQHCYRDTEPINLYHKVGHGTLDMYVISPSKESKEVKEFLQKWHAGDSRLFASRDTKEFNFPLENLVSICAMLVWQPANPEDTITRILFPGSTPDFKILEGLDRIKHLEFMKHPTCTAKTIAPALPAVIPIIKKSIKANQFDKTEPPLPSKVVKPMPSADKQDNKIIDNKNKIIQQQDNKIQESETEIISTKIESKLIEDELKEDLVKDESIDYNKNNELIGINDEIDNKEITEKKVEVVIVKPQVSEDMKKEEIDIKSKTKQKAEKPRAEVKPVVRSRIDTKPPKSMERKSFKKDLISDKKSSPTATPQKKEYTKSSLKDKEIKSKVISRISKSSPSSTPAKSAKDANNRKVLESKQKASKVVKRDIIKTVTEKKETKTERKPISRRPRGTSPSKHVPGSPVKAIKPKSELRKSRLEKGGTTTDSSLVSTPSADEIPASKKIAEVEHDQDIDPIKQRELDDLKEEQEVVREIEAVFNRDEQKRQKDLKPDRREVGKQDSTTEAEEEEEYLIIEKEEIEQYTEDSINDQESSMTKEEEIQKHQRDSQESEKKRKTSAEEEIEAAIAKAEAAEADAKNRAKQTKEIDVPQEDINEKQEEHGQEDDDDDIQPDSIEEKVNLTSPQKGDIKAEVQDILISAKEIVKAKTEEIKTEEMSSLTPEEKISSAKKTSDTKDELLEVPDINKEGNLQESLPEEKFSATIESGATTAPTLPEDERIPLDEIKEDLVIEEKYVKEETKEAEVPLSPPKTVQQIQQIERTLPGKMQFQTQSNLLRDIVKTPDEVADLPVHEEADIGYDEVTSDGKRKSFTKEDGKHLKEEIAKEEKEVEDIENINERIEDEKKILENGELQIVTTKSTTEPHEEEKLSQKITVDSEDKSIYPQKEMPTIDRHFTEGNMIEKDKIDRISKTEEVVILAGETAEKYISTSDIVISDIISDTTKMEIEDNSEDKKQIIESVPKGLTEPNAAVSENEDPKQLIARVKIIEPKDPTDTVSVESPGTIEEIIPLERDHITEKAKTDFKDEQNRAKVGIEQVVSTPVHTAEEKDFIIPSAEQIESADTVTTKKLTTEIATTVKENILDTIDRTKDIVDHVCETSETATDYEREICKDVEAEVFEKATQEKEEVSDKIESNVQKAGFDLKEEIISLKETVKDEIKEVDAKIENIDKVVTSGKKENIQQLEDVKRTSSDMGIAEDTPKIVGIIPKEVETVKEISERVDNIVQVLTGTQEIIKHERTDTQDSIPNEILIDKKPDITVRDHSDVAIETKTETNLTSVLGGIAQEIATVLGKGKEESDTSESKLNTSELIDDHTTEKKSSFEITSFTTELRETHITTIDSPVVEEQGHVEDYKILAYEREDSGLNDIKEEEEENRYSPPRKVSTEKLIKIDSQPPRPVSPREEEVAKIVANVAQVLKSDKPITEIIPDFDEKQLEEKLLKTVKDVEPTVQRMLVTASSEDGGEEIEICPHGSIKFTPGSTPEVLSGKVTPDVTKEIVSDFMEYDDKINLVLKKEYELEQNSKISLTGEESKCTPKSQPGSEKSSPEHKSASFSIEEKDKIEISEKQQIKDVHSAIVQETHERTDSISSAVEQSFLERRQSAMSISSERDITKDESTFDDRPDSGASSDLGKISPDLGNTSPIAKHATDITNSKSVVSIHEHKETSGTINAEKLPSPSIAQSRPVSADKKETSFGSSRESKETKEGVEIEHSHISDAVTKEQQADEKSSSKEISRSESVTSHIDEKLSSRRESVSCSHESKDMKNEIERKESIVIETLSKEQKPDEKSPSPSKDLSSPQSVASHVDEKVSSRRKSIASSHENTEMKADSETKAAIVIETVSIEQKPDKKSPSPTKELSRPESVDSHIDEKVSSRRESIGSSHESKETKADTETTESIISDTVPREQKTDEKSPSKELCRPESVASHIDDKLSSRRESVASSHESKEMKDDIERQDSIVSDTVSKEKKPDEKSPSPSKELSRPESVASHIDDKVSSRRESVVSGHESIETKADTKRKESVISDTVHKEQQVDEKSPSPSKQLSRPESVASYIDDKLSSRRESVASTHESKEMRDDIGRQDSIVSDTVSKEKKPDEKTPSPSKELSRPESVASQIDDKVSSRRESVVSSHESIETKADTERKESVISDTVHKEQQVDEKSPSPTKQLSRPESVASYIDDKLSSRRESVASTHESKEMKDAIGKQDSIVGDTVSKEQKPDEKSPSPSKELSRPESVATHIDDKVSSRRESVVSSHEIIETKADTERKESIISDTVHKEQKVDEKSPSQQLSRPESVASYVDEKLSSRRESVTSTHESKEMTDDIARKESIVSDTVFKDQKADEKSPSTSQELPCPESALSHIDEKGSSSKESVAASPEIKETKTDVERKESIISDTEQQPDEKSPSPSKEVSRPESVASHVDDKLSSRRESVSSSQENKEAKADVERKESIISDTVSKDQKSPSKELSRPESAASHTDTKVSSRRESVTTTHESNEMKDDNEKQESIISDTVPRERQEYEKSLSKELSRPESVASHIDEKVSSRRESVASSHESKETKTDVERKESIISDTVSKKQQAEEKSPSTQLSRPESVASHIDEKGSSRRESLASSHESKEAKADTERKESIISDTVPKEKQADEKSTSKELSRPESVASHIDEKVSSRRESVASSQESKETKADTERKKSIVSDTVHKEQKPDEKSPSPSKELSRPESVASHVDDKLSSRRESVASSHESKETKAYTERKESIVSDTVFKESKPDEKSPSPSKELSRPESVASHIDDKVSSRRESVVSSHESKETKVDTERKESITSDTVHKEPKVDEKSPSRTESVASHTDEKLSSRRLSVASSHESKEMKDDVERKQSTASDAVSIEKKSDEKSPSPSKEISRPESVASHIDEKVSSRRESVASNHETKETKDDTERKQSTTSDPVSKEQKPDEKSPSPSKELSRPESVASQFDAKLCSRRESVASSPESKETKADTDRKESINTDTVPKEQKADTKSSSPSKQLSRQESTASLVGDKLGSRKESVASSPDSIEMKADIERRESIPSDAVCIEQKLDEKSPSSPTELSRSDSVENHIVEKVISTKESVAARPEIKETKTDVETQEDIISDVFSKEQKSDEKSPSPSKELARPESGASHVAEEVSSRRESVAVSLDLNEKKTDVERNESIISDTLSKDEKPDEKSPSPSKELSRPDSVATHVDDKLSSRRESVASSQESKESKADNERKESIISGTVSKKQQADEKSPSPTKEVSRPESVASHVDEKVSSRRESIASSHETTEMKDDNQRKESIVSDVVSIEQKVDVISPSPTKEVSRPESVASNVDEKVSSRRESIASSHETKEMKDDSERKASIVTETVSKEQKADKKSPSPTKEVSRPESVASHVDEKVSSRRESIASSHETTEMKDDNQRKESIVSDVVSIEQKVDVISPSPTKEVSRPESVASNVDEKVSSRRESIASSHETKEMKDDSERKASIVTETVSKEQKADKKSPSPTKEVSRPESVASHVDEKVSSRRESIASSHETKEMKDDSQRKESIVSDVESRQQKVDKISPSPTEEVSRPESVASNVDEKVSSRRESIASSHETKEMKDDSERKASIVTETVSKEQKADKKSPSPTKEVSRPESVASHVDDKVSSRRESIASSHETKETNDEIERKESIVTKTEFKAQQADEKSPSPSKELSRAESVASHVDEKVSSRRESIASSHETKEMKDDSERKESIVSDVVSREQKVDRISPSPTKEVSRPESVASHVDEQVSSRRESIASSHETKEMKDDSERKASIVTESVSKEQKADKKSPSPTKEVSRPELVASHVDETVSSIKESIASSYETKETNDKIERKESIVTETVFKAQQEDEKSPSPLSRAESVASHVDEKVSSRRESIASSHETKEMKDDSERKESIVSDVVSREQKVDKISPSPTKEVSRPESVASHVDEQVSSRRESIASSHETKEMKDDSERKASIVTETVSKEQKADKKSPSPTKEVSRPESVASHVDDKVSSRRESIASSHETKETNDEIERKESIVTKTEFKAQQADEKSPSPSKELSPAESVASHVDEKVSSRRESIASSHETKEMKDDSERKESIVSDVVSREQKVDRISPSPTKEVSRPESVASHGDEKVSSRRESIASSHETKEMKDDSERKASIVTETVSKEQKADKKSPSPTKEVSRPESVASHVAEKVSSRRESIASSHETKETNDEIERKESIVTKTEFKAQQADEKSPSPSKELSRAESLASHVDEKVSSRRESIASSHETKEMKDDSERKESIVSDVVSREQKVDRISPSPTKEVSRPESVASHVDEHVSSRRESIARSHETKEMKDDSERKASIVTETVSKEQKADKKSPSPTKEVSRPESVASHVDEKVSSRRESIASSHETKEMKDDSQRKESIVSDVESRQQKVDKISPSPTEEVSRPESVASHGDEKVSSRRESIASSQETKAMTDYSERKASIVTETVSKEQKAVEKLPPPSKEISRPESVASHDDEKVSSRRESIASSHETKEMTDDSERKASIVTETVSKEQKAVEKLASPSKDISRPESVASHVDEKVSSRKESVNNINKSKEITDDSERKDAIVSDVVSTQQKADEISPSPTTEVSRPESVASHIDDKESSRRESVARSPETKETKADDESKKSIFSDTVPKAQKTDQKAASPSNELSRPASVASHIDEKVSSRRESVASSHETKETKDDTERKQSIASDAVSIEQKSDDKSPSPSKEVSRPESVASHIDEKVSSRRESVAASTEIKETKTDVERKESIINEAISKKQKSDEKLSSPSKEVSRPESAASHIDEKVSSGRESVASSHETKETKDDTKKKESISSATVSVEQKLVDKSPSPSKEVSRPESVASHIDEKVSSRRESVASSHETTETKHDTERKQSIASVAVSLDQHSDNKSPSPCKELSRPESVASHKDEQESSRRESFAASTEIRETKTDVERKESGINEIISKKQKSHEKLSSPSKEVSRPESVASHIDEKVSSRRESVASSHETKETKDDTERKQSTASDAVSIEQKSDEKSPSPSKEVSRPESVASHIDEKVSSRRESVASSHETKETKDDIERKQSTTSDPVSIEQKSDEKSPSPSKEVSRPESVAGHIDEKVSSRRESVASSHETKETKDDTERKQSIASDAVSIDQKSDDKSPTPFKEVSRPESVASQIDEKVSSRGESVAASPEIKETKDDTERKQSIAIDTVSIALKSDDKSPSPSKEVSRPESVASHIGEKGSSRSESVAASTEIKEMKTDVDRIEFIINETISEKQKSDDKLSSPSKEVSRPESVASQIDEKVSSRRESVASSHETKETENDTERKQSIAIDAVSLDQKSDEKSPSQSKELSRPESVASQIDEKVSSRKESVAASPEIKETKDDTERKQSTASDAVSIDQKSDDKSPSPSKEVSRPESVASHIDEKVSSRRESVASSHETKETEDDTERKQSIAIDAVSLDQKSDEKSPSQSKEVSRPESVASQIDEKVSSRKESVAASPEIKETKDDTERKQSTTSDPVSIEQKSDDKSPSPSKEVSSPESDASHIDEKVSSRRESVAASPEIKEKKDDTETKQSIAIDAVSIELKSDDKSPSTSKEVCRPESVASHIGEEVSSRRKFVAASPEIKEMTIDVGSKESIISDTLSKELKPDEESQSPSKELSRPDSIASHIDEKESSRSESVAASTEIKEMKTDVDRKESIINEIISEKQKSDDKLSSPSKEVSRPESVASHIDEKVSSRRQSVASSHETKKTKDDTERKQSIAIDAVSLDQKSDEKSPSQSKEVSRPESAESHIDGKVSSRRESVAASPEIKEIKIDIERKESIVSDAVSSEKKAGDKSPSPFNEVLRPDSLASQVGDKLSSRREYVGSSHESKETKADIERKESIISDTVHKEQKTDEKSPSKQVSHPESVASNVDAKLSSRRESVTSSHESEEKTDDIERKEYIVSDTVSKEQQADEKSPSPSKELSGSESAANHIDEIVISRTESISSTHESKETKTDTGRTKSLLSVTGTEEQKSDDKVSCPATDNSRPESVANRFDEKEISRREFVIGSHAAKETQKMAKQEETAISEKIYKEQNVQEIFRTEFVTSQLETKEHTSKVESVITQSISQQENVCEIVRPTGKGASSVDSVAFEVQKPDDKTDMASSKLSFPVSVTSHAGEKEISSKESVSSSYDALEAKKDTESISDKALRANEKNTKPEPSHVCGIGISETLSIKKDTESPESFICDTVSLDKELRVTTSTTAKEHSHSESSTSSKETQRIEKKEDVRTKTISKGQKSNEVSSKESSRHESESVVTHGSESVSSSNETTEALQTRDSTLTQTLSLEKQSNESLTNISKSTSHVSLTHSEELQYNNTVNIESTQTISHESVSNNKSSQSEKFSFESKQCSKDSIRRESTKSELHSSQPSSDHEDNVDDELLAIKDSRSKSIASIMMTSIYKPSDELHFSTLKEELSEQQIDLTESITSSKSEAIPITSDRLSHISISPESDVCRKFSDDDIKETKELKSEIETIVTSYIESTEAFTDDRRTPPTAPVSPNIKAEFTIGSKQTSSQQTSCKSVSRDIMTASGTSSPKDLSGKSSPGITISESRSIPTPADHSSMTGTPDSSPKPTSPFPRVSNDDLKGISTFSTPDVTRTSSPDVTEIRNLEQSALTASSEKIITTTVTTITKIISSDGKETVTEEKTVTTRDTTDPDEERVTVTRTRTTSENDKKDEIKLPSTKDIAALKTEFRCSTPGSDDFDPHEVQSPRSDISSGQASRVTEDDEIPPSPLSITSHAAHSPPSKFSYEYDLQHSSSGVSKKSDLDIDNSQDDIIPPQYGSEELKSALPVTLSHKIDPMSTSFYGALPDTFGGKSEPIPIQKSSTSITRTYQESLDSSQSGGESFDQSWILKRSDHKFLDEADLDFEKALEEHKQVRGAEIMSSVTAKYSYSPSQTAIVDIECSKQQQFPLEDPIVKVKEIISKKQFPIDEVQKPDECSSTSKDETKESKLENKDPSKVWGKPLGLPSPAPITTENDLKTTPKKERKLMASKTKFNNEKNLRKRSESPVKGTKKNSPIYMDLTYVPHNGNSYYSHVEFFKKVRARYYVFSGTEPSREVYNALLEAKQTWEDKDLEVTIIPTYDTDVLGYWVSENEELLAKYHIDLSPSASRCTINLQDHETSCSAYRLEF